MLFQATARLPVELPADPGAANSRPVLNRNAKDDAGRVDAERGIRMRRRPLFPMHVIGASPTDYLRNFWCRYYRTCLGEAAAQNKYLSCSLCGYRRSRALAPGAAR